MKNHRVLIVSNVRPSRTWNFANRILSEVPGAEICGVVQRSMRSIPWVQQMIAAGATRATPVSPGWWSRARLLIHSMADKLLEWFIWFLHGCPAALNNPREFTIQRLARECSRVGWPLAVIPEGEETSAAASICGTDVHLVVLLGERSSTLGQAIESSHGCIVACARKPNNTPRISDKDILICIEHMAPGTASPSSIFSIAVPWQPLDGPLGFTLKADLIADDLLLQTAGSLLTENDASASATVSQWANKVLEPSLSQLKGVAADPSQAQAKRKRCRSPLKLCFDTLLLCSPKVFLRNWYWRLTGRYPLLILAHHLVSDRPHRMGVSTETFWQEISFLKKHYRILMLSEGAELLGCGQIEVPTVVLTFDDGYADNFLNLRAVVNEAGISSTLFITTNPVEAHREFDHDLRTGKTGFLPLTWDQIRYWNARGAEFGSHTRTHFDCGSAELESLKSEIIGSRNDLEAHLKKPVDLFAFPYGRPENMSPEAMRLAASTYRHFVSCCGGQSLSKPEHIQNHLFRKKFYGNRWELELELQSVFDLVDTLKLWLRPWAVNSSNGSSKVPTASALPSPIRAISAQPSHAEVYSRAKNA